VLIFDEPNTNFDVEPEQVLIKTILNAKVRGRAVSVMAHRRRDHCL
jgi:ABC-type protease/lipase transport system fused ATPase/permease subunit